MMRKRPLAGIVIGLLVLAAMPVIAPRAAGQSRDQADVLLQAAVHKDVVEGHLEEAIRLYLRVARDFGGERATAATALLRAAAAYERLGNPAAVNTYERLLREYGDQVHQVSSARSRLAALRPATPPAEPPPVRRLILDSDALEGGGPPTPTEDGRHVLRYNPERRGFDLMEIETEEIRALTSDGPAATASHLGEAALSPDGRRIAFAQHLPARPEEPFGSSNLGETQLRIIEVGGRGSGELLHAWSPGHQVRVFGWSPRQDRLWIIVRRPDVGADIASVNLSTRALDVVKAIAWRPFSQPPSLSPDGDFIAYEGADDRDAPHDVFLLAADGSRETRIEHPASDTKPMFAPDGSGIVFASDRRDDIRDLWFLPVRNGRPTGDPRMVFEDVSPYGHVYRFANNGSVFYYIATNRSEVYTASLDLAAGRVGAPVALARLSGEENNAPAFSPDGRYLAHLRNRGRRLVVRDLATGSEREFPTGGGFVFVESLDWCSDGRAVLITGFRRTRAAYRIDVVHGGMERLPLADPFVTLCIGTGDEVVHARLVGDVQSGQYRLTRHVLQTGVETVLYQDSTLDYSSIARWPSVTRSPDGRSIAFVEQDYSTEARLVVMPVAGGTPTVIARSPVYQLHNEWLHDFVGTMWLPDGTGLLVVRRVGAPRDADPSPEVEIWRVPLDGSRATEVGRMRLPAFERAYYGAFFFTLHPDGTRFAFERHAGLVEQVWAIDNLLQFIESGASVRLSTPVPR